MPDHKSKSIPREVDTLLSKFNRTYWVTLRKDGSPTAHPMSGLYEQSRLRYTSYKKSIKNRNIERDPRTCVLATNGYGSESNKLEAATLKGIAVIVDAAQTPSKLGRESDGTQSGGTNRARAAIEAGRRSVVEIVPTEIAALTQQVREG